MSRSCVTCDNFEKCCNSGLELVGAGSPTANNCKNYTSEWENTPLVWTGPDGVSDAELYGPDCD